MFIVPLHPGDYVPHSDALGVPAWLQWLIAGALVVVGVRIVSDARSVRRRMTLDQAGAADSSSPKPQSAHDPSEPGESLVASDLLGKPRRTPRRDWRALRGTARTGGRVLLFAAGGALGWFGFDQAYDVTAFASFIGSVGTTFAARFAFACAALFWVGAALALVAPRWAAVAFAAAATAGFILLSASFWEERLEWWGIAVAAQQWEHVDRWCAAAILLGVGAILADRPARPRDFTSA